MRKRISQREARAFKKRMGELEALEQKRISAWSGDWPGLHLGSVILSDAFYHAIKTARRLGHPVIAVHGQDNTIHFYAARD